jgi:hypothetical protein
MPAPPGWVNMQSVRALPGGAEARAPGHPAHVWQAAAGAPAPGPAPGTRAAGGAGRRGTRTRACPRHRRGKRGARCVGYRWASCAYTGWWDTA